MRYQHELTFEEVAQALNRPTGTVSRQVHEAREELKRRLAPLAGALAVKLDAMIESLPLPPAPPTLAAKLENLLRPAPVIPKGGFRLARVATAAAILVPVAAVVVLIVVIASRPSVRFQQGPAETVATAPVSPPAAPASSADGDPGEDSDSILPPRNRRAVFRIKIVDPKTGLLLSPDPRRSVAVLAVLADPEMPPIIEGAAPDGAGAFLAIQRCNRRTLYSVFAALADGTKLQQYLMAGPDETVDVTLKPGETSRSPQEALLEDLESHKTFGAIRGRIVGTPPPDRYEVEVATPDGREAMTFRDAGGFLLVPVSPGRAEVRYVDRCCTQAFPIEVRGGEVADLAIPHILKSTRTVSGLVLDSNGRAAGGAEVFLFESVDGPAARHFSTAADASGRFRFEGLDPDLKDLRIGARIPPAITGRSQVPEEAGETVIRLPPTMRFHVKLVTPSRVPIEGKVRIVEGLPPGNLLYWIDTPGPVASDNPFVIDAEAVPPGTRVRFEASADGCAAVRTDPIELHDGGAVEVALTPAR